MALLVKHTHAGRSDVISPCSITGPTLTGIYCVERLDQVNGDYKDITPGLYSHHRLEGYVYPWVVGVGSSILLEVAWR